jgi:hypothetical protein
MSKTLEDLFAKAESIANKKFDGHLTLLKFTTGWKAAFYTPNLDTGEGREQVQNLPSFSTKEEALMWLIAEEVSFL